MTTQRKRPLSPHLQVYDLPLAARISITHRITGTALSAGILLVVYWLGALAMGEQSFLQAQAIFSSWFGLAVLFGFSLALSLHLAHGIRHLIWDFSIGISKSASSQSNIWIIVITIGLTAASWAFGFYMAGN